MRMLALVTVAALAAGCASMGMGDGQKAVAKLEPTQGNNARGTVTFTQRGGEMTVVAELSGLKPNADHGFHVHEKGDCSSADGMSAGGHFNPGNKPHGYHMATERHAGDLPNVRADASGNAKATFQTSLLAIGSGAHDILGKGVIVHRDPDDFNSQPAGNSGPRIACGIIQKP